MTIDINLLRPERGGDPQIVRESEARRCRDGSNVDRVMELDAIWRELQFQMEQCKKDQNAISRDIAGKKKADAKADVSELVKRSAELKSQLPELEKKSEEAQIARDEALSRIGNILHPSVLGESDEEKNLVLRTWGTIPDIVCKEGVLGSLAHWELITKLGGVDLERGNRIFGHRGYFLVGVLASLNLALIQYGQSFLRKRGYTPMMPPYMMKREWMSKAAELADFGETLYCVPSTLDPVNPEETKQQRDDRLKEDLFLIATSEQPLCAYHAGEYLEEKTLPIKYCGFSTCFRKEAGSHGKDMRGIFRVHQFEKVEQFIICSPSDSWDHHEEMIRVSEEFYQTLKLPYRVVSIVGGALNDAAARKYDLEAWFPSYSAYRELVSCSNCTDFQSRALSIRKGAPKMNEREKSLVHLLNGTLCATERTMCCILEHYQTPTGVKIPLPLQPYMDGMTFIPYNN